MTAERRKPQATTSPARPTTGARAPRTAFGRAYRRNAALLPEKATVKAFVAWIRDLGFGGEQLVSELYLEFSVTIELIGGSPLPLKRFGRALAKAGYPPYQADKEKDGKRWRPMAVDLSDVKHTSPVVGRDMAAFGSRLAIEKRSSVSRILRLPRLPRLPNGCQRVTDECHGLNCR